MFIKLDISKAFDTVNWAYLLDIMTFLGFSQRWRNWISALWGTTTSSFLLNGEPGKRIRHLRGVRQGDPLSPMIFLLAMEPLHRMFQLAQSYGLLSHIHRDCSNFRMSLYADDAAVFISPESWDLKVLIFILEIFGGASGLRTDISKTEFFPIRCQGINLTEILGENHMISVSMYLLRSTSALQKTTANGGATTCPEDCQPHPGMEERYVDLPRERTAAQDGLVSNADLFSNNF